MKVKRNVGLCRKLSRLRLLHSVKAIQFAYLTDKREGETDLLFPAAFAQPATMRQLRQDCGGFLFGHWTRRWSSLLLPFLQDLHTHDA